MQEIWRDIPEYAGLYQVSNLGRVKSMKRVIERKNNKILPLNERILRQQNTNGYRFVRLSKNNKIKQHLVHRLVATQFIDNIFNYNEINHIDEDKTNNNVNNLEWCSHKYNINYGTGNERRRKSEKGKKRCREITSCEKQHPVDDLLPDSSSSPTGLSLVRLSRR